MICSSTNSCFILYPSKCKQMVCWIMCSSMFLGIKMKCRLAHNHLDFLFIKMSPVLVLLQHPYIPCKFSDAISQREFCEAHNHIDVQLHIFSQLRPMLTASKHKEVISLLPWLDGLFKLWSTSQLHLLVCCLSPVYISTFMPWVHWLHSPGYYPLVHPRSSSMK